MSFWRGTRVAITGATGFVGYHVALELKRYGALVTAVSRSTSDLRRLHAAGVRSRIASLDDVPALINAFDGCEILVHAAGAVGFRNAWEEYQRVNVQGTRHVLAAARCARVRRIVHTSSTAAVAGAVRPVLLDERATWNLEDRQVPYVSTKRWAEEAALAENGRGLEVVVVNPGSVVGPDDFTESEFGTLCKRFWKGRVRVYFGGGANFVDVRDVACGIRLAGEKGRPGERYLLTGENRTYAEFFADLARAAQRSFPRLQLPVAAARLIGWIDGALGKNSRQRPHLSSAQAKLMGLFFFFDSGKARAELSYQFRPLAQSLADAHAFWRMPRRAAA